jgi:hypothetical protein
MLWLVKSTKGGEEDPWLEAAHGLGQTHDARSAAHARMHDHHRSPAA